MSDAFELIAEVRQLGGKGASRRLRHAKRVPAILYGGGKAPLPLALDHTALLKQLENEAFYSHILNVKVGDELERAVLKALQRHPYKAQIMHLDLQRVMAEQKVHVRVPLHFVGADVAPGVKEQGGAVAHLMSDVEVSCLPADLPSFIEVDLSSVRVGEPVHLSDLKLPQGVDLVLHGADLTKPVAIISLSRGIAAEAEAGAAAGPGIAPGPVAPTE